MSRLFSPLNIRGTSLKNRIFVSPMCQYSSHDGFPNDWHLVHLGSRAAGGAALVIFEATAVSPDGRISPRDAGIWSEELAESYKRITEFISSQGSVAGIQLAHAGRKASTHVPWKGQGEVKPEDGGWQTIAPSALPFAEGFPLPREMSKEDIERVTEDFRRAAQRCTEAGFGVIELHMAHGYLIHEFLSPLSNHRSDEYGGSFENRCRLALEVVQAVRGAVSQSVPLFVRISVTDWTEGGWDIEQSIELSKLLKQAGVDLVDCSSGGNVMRASIPTAPGYQVAFAQEIREKTGIMTGAVGMIVSAEQAENIIVSGQADAVLLARQMLRDPYWALRAAKRLNVDTPWPVQYTRAKQ